MDAWHYGGSLPGNNLPPKQFGALATSHANYYALGAVGPDLFFFLPDFRSPVGSSLIGVVHFLIDAYDKLDSWILADWERYFGPGSENVDEAISRLTGDLSTVVSHIMGSLSALLTNALIDLAAQSHDWWGLFSLGLNIGYDNKDFFWSDMLHYRKTSAFGNALWVIAEARANQGDDDAQLWSERLKAYALGYITHLATDTTGHPFVNEKAGGPFRTHWQRHHLVENHIDAKTYDDLHGTDLNYNMFTECALHYRVAFSEDGGDARALPPYPPDDNSLRGLYLRRRHLDLDSKMPQELATLIFSAMDQTFDTSLQAADHGLSRTTPDIIPGGDGRPDVQTIQDTYHTFFTYLKLSTLDGFNHEKPKPPEVFPNLDFPQLTDPHDDEPGEADDDMSFWDWVLAILRFIFWIVAVVVWLATILPTILMDLGTYVPRLLAYYTIELPLFLLIKAERQVMVMTGYFHPMQDEIDLGLIQLGSNNHGNFLQELSDVDDILGTGLHVGAPTAEPVPDPNYPHQTKFEVPGILDTLLKQRSSEEYHHPWDYPEKTPVELCPTFAGPWQAGDLPHLLFEDNVPVNETLVEEYTAAPTPFETDTISFAKVNHKNNLGDPVNFSSFLMWQLARPTIKASVANWNIDADRGYGYKCWDWNRPSKDLGTILTDSEGHPYVAPCTPPPQSKALDYDPNGPLKIHYLDQNDPGCTVEVRCAERKRRRPKAGGASTASPKGRQQRGGSPNEKNRTHD
ncbi:MAG TPA: zinc dependent phospholipase C family protein [Pyrinomonadaceae bacterium]|nr:zinc dependent phospholipase C family protein [Pyrinomonadaceae bacterium]